MLQKLAERVSEKYKSKACIRIEIKWLIQIYQTIKSTNKLMLTQANISGKTDGFLGKYDSQIPANFDYLGQYR